MQRRHDLVCNCSGVSVTEACGIVSNRVPLGGMAQFPNTTSEEVRKKVLEIKAEAEENKICADCKRVGESVLTDIVRGILSVISYYYRDSKEWMHL